MRLLFVFAFALGACNALLGNDPFGVSDGGSWDALTDSVQETGIDTGLDRGDAADGNADFRPTHLTNLVLWLRADLGVEHDAGVVTAWRDMSERNDPTHDLRVRPGFVHPRYRQSDTELGGRASVEFIAADPYASAGVSMVSGIWSTALQGRATYYFVAWSNSNHGNGGWVMYGQNTPSLHSFNVHSLGASFQTHDDAGVFRSAVIPGDFRGKPLVAYAVLDGPQSAFAINALTFDAGADAAPDFGPVPAQAFTFGAEHGGTSNLQGKLAEVIVYGFPHRLAERKQVLTYLGLRYGIKIDDVN